MLSAHYFARDLARAANDWTVEEWLARDDRLSRVGPGRRRDSCRWCRGDQADRGNTSAWLASPSSLVRRASDSAIRSTTRSTRRRPSLGLPIVIQDSPTVAADMKAPIVVGAHPTTFAEWKALSWHSQAAQVTSLIMQGVFQRFPTLRVLLLGCGGAGGTWPCRADGLLGAHAPAGCAVARSAPERVLSDHFRVGTYSIELRPKEPRTRRRRVRTAIETLPDPERLLVYAGCYPNADWAEQDDVVDLIPAGVAPSGYSGRTRSSSFASPTARRLRRTSSTRPALEHDEAEQDRCVRRTHDGHRRAPCAGE